MAATQTAVRSSAPAAIRTGVHPGFGRVVIDVGHRTAFTQTRDGDRLTLSFGPGVALGAAVHAPNNVRMLETDQGHAALTLAAGATARVYWFGTSLVIDVFDPAAAEPHAAAAAPPPGRMPAPLPAPSSATPDARARAAATPITPSRLPPARPIPDAIPPKLAAATPAPAAPAPSAPAAAAEPAGTPASPVQPSPIQAPPVAAAESGPIALMPIRAAPLSNAGAALSIPFGANASAAAFRRGDTAIVVFDERRPIDLAAVHDDPLFGSATVQLLPAATVLRLPLPAGRSLALTQTPQAWRIGIVDSVLPRQAVVPQTRDGRVMLPIDAPGDVVSIADPQTGATLLVGTQHVTSQAVPAVHRTPDFDLLPTWQGVVVEPIDDSIVMQATPGGLVLSAGDQRLSLSPSSPTLAVLANAAGLTRRFDLRALPPQVLGQRLADQIEAAALAPPLSRGPLRRDAAMTLIALGWGLEAGAMLRLASADDPAIANAADTVGLTAIAALLAGHPAEADGITDPRLNGTDEVTLWRAVRDATLRRDPDQAAGGFAATLPLILAYPEGLRRRLLPLALETMVEGGQTGPAARVLAARADDPSLALAGAMLRASNGDTDGALAAYDALAKGADRRLYALAATRAVELRLTAGRISTGQAADALDSLLYSWRGGKRELALRERVAELRQMSGAWRAALAMLRETETLFPDDRAEIHARLKTCFAALLHDDALDHIAPLDLVALVDDNADLLSDGPEAEALQEHLADRLVALDLPQRAMPVLEKLIKLAPTPVGRAQFGTRLAALRLREDDPKGALAALSASDIQDLPARMVETRALLAARARASLGDPTGAAAALAAVDTPAAAAARAAILEQAKNWPAAEQALRDYVAKTIPEPDILDPKPLTEDQQRTLVRYATAAAQAGDDATLAQLRTHYASRMPQGAFADMFRLLTAQPVTSVADLPRVGQENVLAHDLEKSLGVLKAPSLTQ